MRGVFFARSVSEPNELTRAIFNSHMSIPVLLFASYADAFGARRLNVPVDAPCSVSDLVNGLRRMTGGHVLPDRPLVAVNHVWASGDASVKVGDEVAVIPPVAGG